MTGPLCLFTLPLLAAGTLWATPDTPGLRLAVFPAPGRMAQPVDAMSAGRPVDTPGHTPLTEWLGEPVQVGTTLYDYQQNTSLGKLLAVSSDGVIHGVFMGGVNTGPGRRVLAWCVDDQLTLTSPQNVSYQHSGYGSAAVSGPNPPNGRPADSGVAGYHTSLSGTASSFGIDFAGCTLAFNPETQPGIERLWPHVAVDAAGRVHMVTGGSTTELSETVWYNASPGWDEWDAPAPLLLASGAQPTAAVTVADYTSPRAAVVYLTRTGPEDVAYDGPVETPGVGRNLHNDIRAVVAADGNLAAAIQAGDSLNLTAFGPGSSAPFGAFGCRPFTDVDGILDASPGHNLHLAFSSALMYSDTLFLQDPSGSSALPYYEWNLGRGQLWHLDADTGQWGHIAGYNSSLVEDVPAAESQPQAFRMLTDRPQLAVDPATGYLYCIWSQYARDDRSAAGYYNGEIMARCSADNGATWGPAVNLTDTPSPGCLAGECDAEDWASLAARVDNGFLHISFIHDRDAGGTPQGEGSMTVNPVVYLRVPVAEVPAHTGTAWNMAGHVGLGAHRRQAGWPCAAWSGPGAPLDSVRWTEPVHLFNESPYEVQVDSVAFHHHADDPLGSPEDNGLYELELEVLLGDTWMPAASWDRRIPAWTALRFRARVAWSALPSHDVLLVFHLGGRPDLAYRFACASSDVPGCPAVTELDPDNLAGTLCHTVTCPDARPLAPGGLVIQRTGSDLLLQWNAVTETVAGCPLADAVYTVTATDELGNTTVAGGGPSTSLSLPGYVNGRTAVAFRVTAATPLP